MRLAFVSPLPPAPTGIADYTVDVVRALNGPHSVELFHDQTNVAEALPAPAFPVTELPARAAARAFDAVVYQMGNAPAHDFMYGWMERVRGVVVLHDLVLHHSFARRYLESREALAYAADPSDPGRKVEADRAHQSFLSAIEAVYPGLGERLKDAHFNTTGDLLPYAFPLFEPALRSARAVGAHNAFMIEAIQEARPDLDCVRLAMPVPLPSLAEGTAAAFRAKHGLAEAHWVVGCFGLVTREKRIETVARAVARIAEVHPDVRLLLAGPVSDNVWLGDLLARTRVSGRAVVTGRLDDREFAAAIAAADAVVHLRYPTARETSAALLRVMAQGRPVIVSDIANQAEIPDDVVRRVDPIDEEGGLVRSLEFLRRHPEEAVAMGGRARRFVETSHSLARTLETYERLLKPPAPR